MLEPFNAINSMIPTRPYPFQRATAPCGWASELAAQQPTTETKGT